MNFNLSHIFGIHPSALEYRARRSEVLAQNLANAETPNYKARDLDFKQALASAGGSKLEKTHARHLDASASSASELQYRVPLHPSLDGNTVTEEIEKAEFADNAVRYQASLMFLNRKISGIKSALSDQ